MLRLNDIVFIRGENVFFNC